MMTVLSEHEPCARHFECQLHVLTLHNARGLNPNIQWSVNFSVVVNGN